MTTITTPGNKAVRSFSIDIFELPDGSLCVDTFERFGAGRCNIARNVIHGDDRATQAGEDMVVMLCLKKQIDLLYPIKEPVQ